jgi:hypothetical protein
VVGKVVGLTGAALLTYVIISEGSRPFAPRNVFRCLKLESTDMQIIDKQQTKEWLLKRGLIDPQGSLSLSEFAFSTDFQIPADSGRKTNISKAIGSLLNFPEESLLWINEFGIWPSCEDLYLFDAFRKSIGEDLPLYMKPGHLFVNTDLNIVKSLIAITLYFVWGAIVIPDSKKFLIRISHDEYISIYSKDLDILSQIRNKITPYMDKSGEQRIKKVAKGTLIKL